MAALFSPGNEIIIQDLVLGEKGLEWIARIAPKKIDIAYKEW